MGMKLEAIREDRTRGGRSTYQCSYTLPPGITGQLPEVRGYLDIYTIYTIYTIYSIYSMYLPRCRRCCRRS